MRKYIQTLACIVAPCMLGMAMPTSAQEGPWEVLLRASDTDFAQHSDSIPLWGVPEDALHVDDRWAAELDARYFFARQWFGELSLGYPQSETLRLEHSTLGAPSSAGTFKMFPTAMSVSYDFIPDGLVRPYLGAGINLTRFSNVNLEIPGVGPLELNKGSIGPAVQGGVDIKLAPHWFANANFKWARVRSEVDLCCVRVSEMHLDPLFIGVGVGYRFGARGPQ